MTRFILLMVIFLFAIEGKAQTVSLKGKVSDNKGRPIVAGSVEILSLKHHQKTGKNGDFTFVDLPVGRYSLSFSHVGYKAEIREIEISEDTELAITLIADKININEVYVTATESDDLGTSSIIDREAMELLQPSSFTDILELLPGGRSVDPNLTSTNRIALRDADPLSGYLTNSLGTQFSMDGTVLNSPADLGTLSTILPSAVESSQERSRDNTFSGIDMRGISTDNIEKVEIVRGIVSAEHGNLTSGAVLIDRIKGATLWSARFKADGFSKLFSIGKGFAFEDKGYTLNMDGGYMYASDDPTNIYTNYKRINASLRGRKKWVSDRFQLIWQHTIDVRTTLDGDRMDPDADYRATDTYTSGKRSYILSNKLSLLHNTTEHPFQNVDIYANINVNDNRIAFDKLTQTRSATLLMNAFEEGSHEVSYLTPTYVAKMRITDQPLNFNVKAVSNWLFHMAVKHRVKVGFENNYSKNLGAGQQFDIDLPPSTAGETFPRRFDEIPAYNNFGGFLEDRFLLKKGAFTWENSLGIRAFILTNTGQRYTHAGQLNIEPRWNSRLYLPKKEIYGQPLQISFSGGYGQQTLAPSLAYLYPDNRYINTVELNYFHNDPDYRRAQAYTKVIDPTNYELRSAKSKKWELGTDIHFAGNRLTFTYFRDRLRSGFRPTVNFVRINYKKYDNTSVDPDNITGRPELEDFTFEEAHEYHSYQQTTNGSTSDKEGIEYQFTSPRLPGINTRFTLNGAWFKTLSYNTQPLASVLSSSVVTDGKIRQYVGIYEDVEGFDRRQFNTNFMADTYLPVLGLKFATSVQTVWWSSSRTLPKSDLPIGYYDIDEQFHLYSEADRYDPTLRYFDKKTDPITFRKRRKAIDLRVNIKATKSIKDKMRIAMFINRLLVYTPSYVDNGTTFYRQNLSTPYFGMELNVTL